MTSRTAIAEAVRERWYDVLDVGRQPRIVRACLRFAVCWGGLSAGGVTFAAMVSLTAGLTVLVSLARAFLGDRPELMHLFIENVNSVVPGIIDDGTNGGLIPAYLLIRHPGLSLTTLISGIIVFAAAATMMTGLRRTVRQMFGLGGAPLRFVRGKALDMVGFLALSVTILVSSSLVSGVTFLSERVLDWLGLGQTLTGALLGVGAVLLAGVLDAVLVALIFRFTALVRVPWKDLRQGMILGALGLGVLRLGGTSLIGLSDNPLLASAAAIGTILVWMNLAVRWLLFVAAWTANPPAAHVPVHPDTVHADETPNYVTLSAPHTLDWPHHQVTGALIPAPDPRFHRNTNGNGTGKGTGQGTGTPPAESSTSAGRDSED
ncbi:membrane protein [Kineosphaera limosa]|uniref:Uncharacterized protein n=1 Tax=Kineosphaera limosa NBRC 100340 TaxID=1184609 RepID=K6WSF1_9MICO|nr:YihY/virulence factor BrkB family protein [Kineosphaera limosa]NYE00682.1 membrane protein [Kineosphaera limosa]GAB96771.1 hypothetical protein KILIM_048_00090 [Kineosphaera limosa NBRC 100340]